MLVRKLNRVTRQGMMDVQQSSLKARNIERDNRVSVCIDDQIPQFSFVIISGTAKIICYKENELLKCSFLPHLSTQNNLGAL
jgi:hypothetical protein